MTVVQSLTPLLPGAARVGGRAHLRDVRLWALSVSQTPDLERGPENVMVSTSVESTVTGDWSPAFQVRLDYTVTGVVAAPEELAGRELMSIAAAWVLDYDLSSPDGVTEDDITAFGAVSGAFAAHPYMRELVQSLTGRMGLPPLVLDVMTSPLDEVAKIIDAANNDDSALAAGD